MPQATIQIRTSFRFYQPAFRGCKTAISIDGGEEELRAWGSTDHPVEAGQHTVHVEVLYALNKRVGKATQTVDVAPDETVTLTYGPPLLVFMKGKLRKS